MISFIMKDQIETIYKNNRQFDINGMLLPKTNYVIFVICNKVIPVIDHHITLIFPF